MNSIEKVVELLKKSDTAGHSSSTLGETAPYSDKISSRQSKNHIDIDLKKLDELGFVTPDNIETVKAEEYRVIKRPILRNAFGKAAIPVERGNLVMISSSLPKEGKTYTALNLAMLMAVERDTTVLLVDCDVVNPSLSRILGVQEFAGMTDLLLDKNTHLSDVILNTNIPKLRVLPSGLPNPRSTELLSSERMAELTNELSQRYPDRIIIFDSPPLLLANQAAVLSQLMGQIVIVVEAGNTPQNVIEESIRLLDDEKVIGLVLNKTSKPAGKNYYGAYYSSSSS